MRSIVANTTGLAVTGHDLDVLCDPVPSVPAMKPARLVLGMRHIADVEVVSRSIGSVSAVDVRLTSHLDEVVTRVEAKPLELALEPGFLIAEQLVIALPDNVHRNSSSIIDRRERTPHSHEPWQ